MKIINLNHVRKFFFGQQCIIRVMKSHLLSQLRVFISSTFEDLEEERKYLAEIVFPAFTAKAMLQGVQFAEIDLRWGVPKDAPVIKSCMKEIERTHPFFIGIFGKSDGTVPKLENFRTEYGVFDEYNREIEAWIKKGYSITEMEFLYGAIEHGDVCKSRFFWLDYCTHTQKQESMRKLLLEKGYRIVPCLSIKDLGDKITSFLEELLQDVAIPDAETDELHVIRNNQEKIMRQLLQFYVDRGDFDFNTFYSFLDSRKRLFAVKGSHGVGKSTILAKFLMNYHKDNDQTLLISHFYRGGYVEDIYSHFLLELESHQGYTYREYAEKEGLSNYNSVQEQFKRFLTTTNGTKLVFLVDGLEYAGNHYTDEIKAILAKYENCKLIITENEYSDEDGIVVCYPKELTRAIITTYYGDYGRFLQDELLAELENIERGWDFHSLRAVLHEIRVFGIHNTLSNTVKELAGSSDEQLYEKIISHWKALLIPLRENEVLEVLSLSHYGITENTVRQVCHLQQHEWSLIYAILRPYTINAGDRIWIDNRVFCEVIRNNISEEREYAIRCRLIAFFCDRELSDETFDEYPYQLAMTKQIDDLLDYLIDLDVFHYAFTYRYGELLRYWGGLDEDDDTDYFDFYVYLYGAGYDTLSKYLDCPAPITANTTKAEVLREVMEFIEFTLRPTTCSDYDLLLTNKQLAQGILEEVKHEEELTNIQKAELLLSCGMAFGDIFINPRDFLLQAVRLLEPELNNLLEFYEMNLKLRKLKTYWNSEISIDYCYNVLGIPERLSEVFDIWVRAKIDLLFYLSKKKEVKSCYNSVLSTIDRISSDLQESRKVIIQCALEHNYGMWLHDHGDYPKAQCHLHNSFVLRLKVLEEEDNLYMIRMLVEDYKLISSCQCRTADYDAGKEVLYANGLEEYCSDYIHSSIIRQALANCAASHLEIASSASISLEKKASLYRTAMSYYTKSMAYLDDENDMEDSIKIHYMLAICKEGLNESYDEDLDFIRKHISQVDDPNQNTREIMRILDIS